MTIEVEEIPPAERVLHQAIARKVLHDWAQNRQQVAVPLTLNLARMEPAQRALVLRALAAALEARGTGQDRMPRLHAALQRIGGAIAEMPPHPPDLFPLMVELEQAQLGPHAYAAAALVLDRRVSGERAFLEWLAARLGLPDSVTAGLSRRYRR